MKKIFFLALAIWGIFYANLAQAQTEQALEIYQKIEKNMVLVKGGCYQMGNAARDGNEDEESAHQVCVGDFKINRFEVTQKPWLYMTGKNPAYFSGCGLQCPVEMLSWNDIQKFLFRLNKATGKKYCLPTEAQWEYAASSGGKNQKWAGTSDESFLGDYDWYEANSGKTTHPVGQKKPNDFGLYDMTGNVWEWVADCYGENYYQQSPVNNPLGPSSGVERVLRGGAWYFDPRNIRISLPMRDNPIYRNFIYGFRLALLPED